MVRILDITGHTYGRLTALRFSDSKNGHARWLCRCECGNEVVVVTSSLRNGNTTSCGCYRAEKLRGFRPPGPRDRKNYHAWFGMVRRCTDPTFETYKRYGARGITVCDRWLVYENFLADMGERPEGMSLDRIDNNGNYEPSNCRWATPKEQSHNSSWLKLTDDAVRAIRADTRPLKVIAAEYGLSVSYVSGLRTGRLRPL